MPKSGQWPPGELSGIPRDNQHPKRWAVGSDSYLIEGMRLDLREFVLHVIGIHGPDLLAGGSAKNLDDFHQLVNS